MVIKHTRLLSAPLVIAVLLMVWHTGLVFRTYLLSDTLFLTGLMLLLVGAAGAVRNNGLFDIVGYSTRRFVDLVTNKSGEAVVGFDQYLQRPRRKVAVRLPLLGGAVYLLAAMVAAAVRW